MHTYPRFETRKTHALDGVWEFTFLGADTDPLTIDPSSIAFDDHMSVPGVFDASPAYAGLRGTAVYRTFVNVTPGTHGRIQFGGVGLWARVYVDGASVGECSLPYSGFSLDVPPAEHRLREVVVVIDNRFDSDRVPLFEQFFDFYAYGGIYRSVIWHELPEVNINRVQVRTLDVDTGRVHVRVLLNGAAEVSYAFDGAGPQIADALEFEAVVPNPVAWSPDCPALHEIRVTIDGDDIIERFGLRSITTDAGQVLVNGSPVKLLGYCRHEVHPQFGPALPLQQLIDDLQNLRDLGCNFIRGSHYPQDQRFLDRCDEMGMLVFEESLGWGQKLEHFNSSIFCDQQEAQTRLMVRNSVNHPSVIMWGFLNEGASNDESADKLYPRLIDAIREEDASRLVTYATMHPFDDRHLDKVDVISFNQYPGWYEGENQSVRPLDSIEPHIDKLIANIAERGLSDIPFIISEMGAGAIYGWRDPLAAHWSEEYQADYLDVLCKRVVEDSRIAGVSIWQYCDCRTYASGIAIKRPRAFNNKGTLDEYRRPKMAYARVKACFAGE